MGITNFALRFWIEEYSQKLSKGLSKFYRLICENDFQDITAYDLIFLYSFIIIFVGFLIASTFTVFEDEQKSLNQIKEKVKMSRAALANIAKVLWTIKEVKFNSITLEGYKRIQKDKCRMMDLYNSVGRDEAEELKVKMKMDELAAAKKPPSKKDLKKKRVSTPFNLTRKKSKISTLSSATSLRQKQSGLSTRKSQQSVSKLINRKTVQIDGNAKSK